MNLKQLIKRAKRGLRDDFKLYLVAVSSLTVAFLCLAATLLAVTNLSEVAERWGNERRITVYLDAEASRQDVEQLLVLLSSLAEVEETTYLTAAEARAQFLEQVDSEGELTGLSDEVFPPSIDVQLASSVTQERSAELTERLGHFSAVEEIENYGTWYGQLDSLVTTGKTVSLALALLVMICVLAVVGNTIRLAVAGRGKEIEVMKLCGATDSFVRGPFVIEGTFQGMVAAALAVMLLGLAFLMVRSELDASLFTLAGGSTVFLHPLVLVAVVLGGGFTGAVGSALSLRRYLVV